MTRIKAALAGQMNCIAVTNDFTGDSVYNSQVLQEKWIIVERSALINTVREFLHNQVSENQGH